MPRIEIVYDLDKNSSSTTNSYSRGGKYSVSGNRGNVGSGWTGNSNLSTKGYGSNRRRSSLLIQQDSSDSGKRQPLSVMDNLNTSSTARAQSKRTKTNDLDEVYNSLRRKLLNQGELYCDPDFPATTKSVYPTQPNKRFEWKRPKEICNNPKLFADGVSRFDVRQGELGDCWLLAAVASLSMHESLFYQVVPNDQGFESKNYCGAFHFRFWQFGTWKDVIVDDRLPCSGTRLVFMHSTDRGEFWSALLEKAYAKLNGSYESLIGGTQAEAMEDFTGGLCETIDLTDPPKNLTKLLMKANKRCSLMGCSVEPEDDEIEARLPNGLIAGHAYSITDVRSVKYRGQDVPLVRIRNPWGDSEWKGRWSDSSREWKTISESEKKSIGLQFEDDGEFWMSIEDFCSNYTKLEVCHLGPESLSTDELGGKSKRRWEVCLEVGSWKKNVNAGGCRNYLSTFSTNPQFRVEVIDPDEEDDEDKGTIIVGLMQKDVRKTLQEYHTIGYCIYKLKDTNCGPLDLKFFRFNTSVAKSPSYINQREISGRHKLDPGHYCIVPTTFKPGEEADFIMRIFSEKPNDTGEIDTDNSYENVSSNMAGGDRPDATISAADDERQNAVLRKAFSDFAGNAGYITAYQLRDILNATVKKEMPKFEGFNAEVCRSMVAIYDVDQSGRMEFDEFKRIWQDLRLWKGIFKQHDYDNNGNFNAYELRMALKAVGFNVSNKLLEVLANRYADPRVGTISFEDFLLCTVRLVTCFDLFKHQPKQGDRALFTEDEFLRTFMYV